MGTFSSSPQSTYSVRSLRPIGQLVRQGQYGSPVLDAALAWLDLLGRDALVPVLTAHALLDLITTITKNPSLGVRAAVQTAPRRRRPALGESLSTVGSSMERACQRLRALSDGTECKLELHSGNALLRLENSVRLPALGEDYQTCSMLAQLQGAWPNRLRESLDIWFRHPEPMALGEYRKVVSGARLHFGAQLSGFSFPARFLDLPLGRARVRQAALCEV
jgi:hypothetical protein